MFLTNVGDLPSTLRYESMSLVDRIDLGIRMLAGLYCCYGWRFLTTTTTVFGVRFALSIFLPTGLIIFAEIDEEEGEEES